MPLVKFCPSKGCKNEYTITPPKFCSSCGASFEKNFIPTPSVSPVKPVATESYSFMEMARRASADVHIVKPERMTINDLKNRSTPITRDHK